MTSSKDKMIRVQDRNSFKEMVLSARSVVLANFWALWSKECRIMYAIMCDIATFVEEEDVIIHIDWESQKQLAQELEVFGVPTLLVYVNGCELARYSGIINKEDLIKQIVGAKRRVT